MGRSLRPKRDRSAAKSAGGFRPITAGRWGAFQPLYDLPTISTGRRKHFFPADPGIDRAHDKPEVPIE
jgi:hypothetical protein